MRRRDRIAMLCQVGQAPGQEEQARQADRQCLKVNDKPSAFVTITTVRLMPPT
jgi:hypothetical protein